MRVVPRDHGRRIAFYRSRLGQWSERAEQIGVSQELLAELATLTEEARAAYVAHIQAQQAARMATQRLGFAVKKMASKGSGAILQIRARAGSSGDGVYALASIRPPDKPAPIGPPGQPEKLRLSLCDTGMLTLKWKCKNPRGSAGTIYRVWRSIDGKGFEVLGGTGKKRFADATIPAGATQIIYQIQAVRSSKTGRVARFTVQLGGTAAHVQAQAMQGQIGPPPTLLAA